jgi:hypothetical protein
MQRDRDVNRWGNPGTVLPRDHPNVQHARRSRWKWPFDFESKLEKRVVPTASVVNFVYEIETYGRRQSDDRNTTRAL